MRQLTIEFIRADFETNNCILRTTVYEGSKQKLGFICPKGHECYISWTNWQQGRRCPICSFEKSVKQQRKDFNIIKKSFDETNYILTTIESEYKNNYTKLECICPEGHIWFVRWNNWQQGQRCYICANKKRAEKQRKTFNIIEQSFEKANYILITKEDDYENACQKLECICPKGHYYSVTWNKWQQGRRCPYCFSKTSRWEKKIRSFVGCLNVDYIPNDRTILRNHNTGYFLELDIWFPQLNKAIECNGIYWHGMSTKKNNDKIKQQLCKQQDIDLLIVTDEEWKKDVDMCKGKIKSFVMG